MCFGGFLAICIPIIRWHQTLLISEELKFDGPAAKIDVPSVNLFFQIYFFFHPEPVTLTQDWEYRNVECFCRALFVRKYNS